MAREPDEEDAGATMHVRMEEWASTVQRVCAAQLHPDDPCVIYLRNRGYDLGGVGGVRRFTDQPSPLGGKRWYLTVSIRGREGEFLIDTGASHSMIGRGFFRSLAVRSDVPVGTGRVSTADGSEMQTYGRQVLPMRIGDGTYVVSPTVAELSDDGILGLDFCSLYGAVMDTSTGLLVVRHPTLIEHQCVLRRISGVSTVVQTVKVAPQHVCNVLIQSKDFSLGRMGVVEPDTDRLAELGLVSTSTLVQNSRWTVVPVCNPTHNPVYLEKGTVFGTVTWADVNGRADSLEVERAAKRAAHIGSLEFAATAIVQQGDGDPPETNQWGLPLHLLPLITDCHLKSEEGRLELAELLRDSTDVFAVPGAPLGKTERVTHKIDTGNAQPIRLPYRRLPFSKKSALEDEVDKMLEEGVVRPSESPWSSPVVMVTKKDGTCRFCIDYR